MGQKVNIALDWDGTVTADPVAFYEFCKLMRSRGHKFWIVTMRYASECAEILESDIYQLSEGLITTDRGAKKPAVEKVGIKIHIWIDDIPRAILENASQIWGTILPEGQVHTPVHGEPNPYTQISPSETWLQICEEAPSYLKGLVLTEEQCLRMGAALGI